MAKDKTMANVALTESQLDRVAETSRIFQGAETKQICGNTGKPAVADAWYCEPLDYQGDVLYSPAFATRGEAESFALTGLLSAEVQS